MFARDFAALSVVPSPRNPSSSRTLTLADHKHSPMCSSEHTPMPAGAIQAGQARLDGEEGGSKTLWIQDNDGCVCRASPAGYRFAACLGFADLAMPTGPHVGDSLPLLVDGDKLDDGPGAFELAPCPGCVRTAEPPALS